MCVCRCHLRATIEVTRLSQLGVLVEVTHACTQTSPARTLEEVTCATTQNSSLRVHAKVTWHFPGSGGSKPSACSLKSLTHVHTSRCDLYVYAEVNCACTQKSPSSSYVNQSRADAFNCPHACDYQVTRRFIKIGIHEHPTSLAGQLLQLHRGVICMGTKKSVHIVTGISSFHCAQKSLTRTHKKSRDSKIVIASSS